MIGPGRLLELVAVAVAIAGATWCVAVPRFGDCARPGVLENVAGSALANVASAQREGLEAVRYDRNCDGRAEHVGLADLAMFGLLSERWRRVNDDGTVDTGGYRYRLWLPSPGGGFVPADAPGAAVDPLRAAREWRLYAWPVDYRPAREPGVFARLVGARREPATTRAFVVDETGVVRACANGARRYSGTRPPAFDAAFGDGAGADPWVPYR